MAMYESSMNSSMGFGFLITVPKSLIETPIPLTNVRNAKSHVTIGLSGMNMDENRRPMITPDGVSTGMKRSK